MLNEDEVGQHFDKEKGKNLEFFKWFTIDRSVKQEKGTKNEGNFYRMN